MDSKIEIEIEFDQPNAVYFSGQIVSGTVQISLTEPKTVEGVLLNIHGFGKTEWHKGNQSKPPDYVGFEEYLLMNTYLLDCLNESSIELPVGVQSFPFQYQLPNNLPSSYEGMYGHVRYQAKVVIEYGKYNQSYEVGFTVYKTIDLDRDCPQSRVNFLADWNGTAQEGDHGWNGCLNNNLNSGFSIDCDGNNKRNEYTALATKYNPLSLAHGYPDFAPPSYIIKALVEATTSANPLLNQYTRGFGHPRLVQKLSDLYSKVTNRDIDPITQVLVTCGAYEALYASITGHVDNGDEVIIIEPFFDCYEPNGWWNSSTYCSQSKSKVDLSSETDKYRDYRFTKWMMKNIGLQAIPPSAFYSEENKHLGENFVIYCFAKKDENLLRAKELLQKLK